MDWPSYIGREHVLDNDLNSKIIAKNMLLCVSVCVGQPSSHNPLKLATPSLANCLQLALKERKVLKKLRPKLPWTQHFGLAGWIWPSYISIEHVLDNDLNSKIIAKNMFLCVCATASLS